MFLPSLMARSNGAMMATGLPSNCVPQTWFFTMALYGEVMGVHHIGAA